MMLVAATAAGLGMGRVLAPRPFEEWFQLLAGRPASRWWTETVWETLLEIELSVVTPSLAALSAACLGMTLRGRGEEHRRLVRRPGAMACLLATTVFGISAALAAVVRVSTWPENPGSIRLLLSVIFFGAFHAGSAVWWGWLAMGVIGRWRPEPSWIDRLGRVLGAAWIVIAAIHGFMIVTQWPA
jgi:hypothetical protein